MQLRSVDPRTLRENPANPRRTPSSPASDAVLQASIQAVGVLQPPLVWAGEDGTLFIEFGHRRARLAAAAGLAAIDVLVADHGGDADAMRALAENIAREPLNPVDQWRAVDRLTGLGWTDEAIALALALPARQVRKLKLLAHLHPAMLDHMASGDMPDAGQLRTIAGADQAEQAGAWKRHKPKKGGHAAWHELARALAKRRVLARHACFGPELAEAYGISWENDLFAPADEDGRFTTAVEAFFGAQAEWLASNLPPRGAVLETDQWGSPKLPPKAQRVWSEPGETDRTGWHLDPRTGEVKSIAYRVPEAAMATKQEGGRDDASDGRRSRPEVTRKGVALIGDLRTEALHRALRTEPIPERTLLALLVLGYAGQNVTVATDDQAAPYGRSACASLAAELLGEDGALAIDDAVLGRVVREILVRVFSCREGRSDSGAPALIAGAAVGADRHLPNMAREEFLSCLSRPALERALAAAALQPKSRAKESRQALVDHYSGEQARFIHGAARFAIDEAQLAGFRPKRGATIPPAGGLVDEDPANDGGQGGPVDEEWTDQEAMMAAE